VLLTPLPASGGSFARLALPVTAGVLVVGAGIHGLCTAFHLHRSGVRDLVVVDRFHDGHQYGSSHGLTRITRSSYGDRRWVALAQQAHRVGWPELAAELGQQLLWPTPGLFFGPTAGPFAEFLAATLGSGAAVERVEPLRARQSCPLLRIDDRDAVLLDHTAAVVAAERALAGLLQWCDAQQILRLPNWRVMGLRRENGLLVAESDQGVLRARCVVLAAGAGMPKLLSEEQARLVVLRQQVGYFQPPLPASAMAPGVFPVWARIGVAVNDFHYGLPEFGRPGVKLAQHRTVGDPDDAEELESIAEEAGLRQLALERFSMPSALIGSETCLYTMAPCADLQVRLSAPGLVAIVACSGHAFKFAPEIGRQAAAMALSQVC
jgi:sarcosine oxidase